MEESVRYLDEQSSYTNFMIEFWENDDARLATVILLEWNQLCNDQDNNASVMFRVTRAVHCEYLSIGRLGWEQSSERKLKKYIFIRTIGATSNWSSLAMDLDINGQKLLNFMPRRLLKPILVQEK